jgi:hypothetical protein
VQGISIALAIHLYSIWQTKPPPEDYSAAG